MSHTAFDADVHKHGRYEYTGDDRLSSVRANRRYTEMIVGAADLTGKDVVDIGCGDGTYSAELARHARSVLGVDPSAAAIDSAQRFASSSLTFRTGVAADLSRRFDVAVYRGVIHHVADPAAEVAHAVRLADTIIFLEPNGSNPAMKLVERVSPYHRKHEERSFSARAFRRWVTSSGGRVRLTTYFGLVPYFAPDWFVHLGSALEPFVERVPGLRMLLCGQYVMVVDGALDG